MMASQRILIVDDDPNVATVTAEMVRALGAQSCRGLVRGNCTRSLEGNRRAFDLVIVDYPLGRGSGAKVAAA